MKALALVVLLALPAFAGDAPLRVEAQTPAPFTGTLVPDSVRVAEAKRVVACEAERDSLKVTVTESISPAVVALLVVAGVVVGGAAGAGVVLAVKK